jgi:hypothetical protein
MSNGQVVQTILLKEKDFVSHLHWFLSGE